MSLHGVGGEREYPQILHYVDIDMLDDAKGRRDCSPRSMETV